jgi:hypothetical protein
MTDESLSSGDCGSSPTKQPPSHRKFYSFFPSLLDGGKEAGIDSKAKLNIISDIRLGNCIVLGRKKC